ncbi:MAG TPA: hypothetical protein VGF67_32280 [Ktedonobacteraceae bacterium]
MLLDHRCPLAPQRYRQEKGYEHEAVTLGSTIAQWEMFIRPFKPVVGTRTPACDL